MVKHNPIIPKPGQMPSPGLQAHCKKVFAANFGKRGKDIKTFEDLPPDVQQTIDSLSMVDGKICQRVKANRTAIAINYQHLFPDRYESQGVTGSGSIHYARTMAKVLRNEEQSRLTTQLE